jgi:hypothetical protein
MSSYFSYCSKNGLTYNRQLVEDKVYTYQVTEPVQQHPLSQRHQ